MKDGLPDIKLDDVESTMLLTLYSRALESVSPNPIINDPMAVEITGRLNPLLKMSPVRLQRDMATGRINRKMSVFLTLRARRFDKYAREFLQKAPAGVIADLGCGLDTRFWRVDNGQVSYYDIDLAEVTGLKRRLLQATGRYHIITSSVLDFKWMEQVRSHTGPYLFLAEGLLMYLEYDGVKGLVTELAGRFPGSELVCEVVSKASATGGLSWATKLRMKRQAHMGRDAAFRFGVKNAAEMEGWAPGIKLLDEWSHFDDNERKLGWVRLAGNIPSMRRVQWTVHFRLGGN